MDQLQIHIPLGKVDEEKRLVYGRAVQEVADKSGEILDYATAKPAFQKWSDDISTASRGLSKGNVRVMHDAKSAAGKVTDLHYNDDDRAIEVCCKVVDDGVWKKVLEGVYTGFSVGGSYARKWKDPDTGLTKYTPKVTELSLVDNPCIPTCRIVELQKADGSVTDLVLRGRARSFDEVLSQTSARSFDEVLGKGLFSRAGRAAAQAADPWAKSNATRLLRQKERGMAASRRGRGQGPSGAAIALGAGAALGVAGAGLSLGKGLIGTGRTALLRARNWGKQAMAHRFSDTEKRLAGGAAGVAAGGLVVDRFGLSKGWDEDHHPREHDGKFASKRGEYVGRGVGIAAGVAGGLYLGAKHGGRIGEKIGQGLGRLIHPMNPIGGDLGGVTGRVLGNRHGWQIAASAGSVVGGGAGGAVGAAIDQHGRRRRADREYDARARDGLMTQDEAEEAKGLYRRSKGRGLARQRSIEGTSRKGSREDADAEADLDITTGKPVRGRK